MKDITFELVTNEDIEELTAVSVRSFHSDINHGAEILKGPPGYDSVDFHREMLKESSCFYKILSNREIIGGFWFMKQENEAAYLYRIFLDPGYHRKGIGLRALNFLRGTFPEIKVWRLKTPKWNTRTQKFYVKAGFKISEIADRFNFYEKRMN